MCDPPCGRFPRRNTRTIGADARYGLVTAERLLSPDQPLVLDVECDSRFIPSFVHPGRNGYLWLLVERRADGIDFVDAEPFVQQNVFTTIDPRTGRPSYDPERVPGTGRRAVFCPSHQGGKNWQPAAFNSITRLLYIPANENLCASMTATRWSTRW